MSQSRPKNMLDNMLDDRLDDRLDDMLDDRLACVVGGAWSNTCLG